MNTILILFISVTTAISVSGQNISTNPQEKSTEPVQVVKDFLTAYMEKKHERFTSLLHPDVIWIQPGDNRISGVKKSKTELLQMGRKMSELSAGTLKLTDVKYYSYNGNTVVCILHWKAAQPTGSTLDIDNIDVYTVENGKIIMAKIFSEDILAEDKFWGK